MLNKIILELGMNFLVLDVVVCCEESLYHVCIVLLLNRIPIGDVAKVLRYASLIFNDCVMQDDATCHDLS